MEMSEILLFDQKKKEKQVKKSQTIERNPEKTKKIQRKMQI